MECVCRIVGVSNFLFPFVFKSLYIHINFHFVGNVLLKTRILSKSAPREHHKKNKNQFFHNFISRLNYPLKPSKGLKCKNQRYKDKKFIYYPFSVVRINFSSGSFSESVSDLFPSSFSFSVFILSITASSIFSDSSAFKA